jgi:hypothetical protein
MAESAEIILARIDQRLAFLVSSHNELKEEIKPVIDDVKKMKTHLYNDDLTGNDGLIRKVDKQAEILAQILEDKKVEKRVNKIWAGLIAGAVTAAWKVASYLWF